MKLGEEISWLMGRLQQNLFPRLEECWETPLTEKEQQLVAILELVRIENYIPKSAFMQLMGRKTVERAAIAHAFVAKMVYTLKPELVGHVSRDSTAIEGREKPVKKEVKVKPW